MRLNSKQDVEAPLAFVFSCLENFDGWERAALRHGAEVTRTDNQSRVGPGMAWNIAFAFRGKRRQVALTLTDFEQDFRLGFSGQGPNLTGTAALTVLELGARRTRLSLELEVLPRTLAARLFLQSLKLARGKVTRRLDLRLAQLSAEIEDRYRRDVRR